MKFQTHKFKITGILPLLTHNPAGMKPATKGPGLKKIPSAEDEAKGGLYENDKGQFCVPSVAFRSALLNGLKFKKIGKKSAISVFQAFVLPVDEFTVLVDPETRKPLKDYVIDTRRAVIQRSGILRSRPKFPIWGCDLQLSIDEDGTEPEMVAENLNIAGSIIGVGDFRVEKKGMFGTFTAELADE